MKPTKIYTAIERGLPNRFGVRDWLLHAYDESGALIVSQEYSEFATGFITFNHLIETTYPGVPIVTAPRLEMSRTAS